MTYRRLFRYLLIGSTLLLAGTWGLSLRSDASFNAFVPGHHFHCRFYRGAMVFIGHEGPYPAYGFQFFQLPAVSMHFQGEHPHGPMGAFRTGTVEALSIVYRYLVFPLWLPYLLVVGGAFGGLKWLERRRKGGEKELAGRAAGGGNS